MSRPSTLFTLPRRSKRVARAKVIPLDDKSTIYSTLSRKPADLETTDIDLSAIRVFLGDDSHRTISSTPNTTCGEILTCLLDKLGLSDQRELYALQITYYLSEPRLAKDSEKVCDLNKHVWDSVSRIYLSRKECSPYTPEIPRKRLVSYHGSLTKGPKKSSHQTITAVFSRANSSIDPGRTEECEPVIVNDKLMTGFAKAWSTALELQKEGQVGGQTPLPSYICDLEPHSTKTVPSPMSSPHMHRKSKSTADSSMRTVRRRHPVQRSKGSSLHSTPHGSPMGTPYGTPFGSPTGTPFGTPLGSSHGTLYGTSLGSSPGTPLGSSYDTQFSTPFGTPLGSSHGTSFGTPLGSSHNTQFSTSFGTPLGSSHGTPFDTSLGSSYDTSWHGGSMDDLTEWSSSLLALRNVRAKSRSTSPSHSIRCGANSSTMKFHSKGSNGGKTVRSPISSDLTNKGNVQAHPSTKSGQGRTTLSKWKSKSVECLRIHAVDSSNQQLTASPSETLLRDSGYQDSSFGSQTSINSNSSTNEDSHAPPRKTIIRRKSASSVQRTQISHPSSRKIPTATSVPSLATVTQKAPYSKSSSYDCTSEGASLEQGITSLSPTNFHAATLKSYGSMELLTCDDIEAIKTNALNESSPSPTDTPGASVSSSAVTQLPPPPDTAPPPVPKRVSAFFENCTIPDDYLLSQGKRINTLLRLSPASKKEEKGAFKTLQKAFTKVGTLLRKGRKPLSSEASVQSTSSPSDVQREFAIASSPSASPATVTQQVNSMGVRMSRVQYDDVCGPKMRSLSCEDLSTQDQHDLSQSYTTKYPSSSVKWARSSFQQNPFTSMLDLSTESRESAESPTQKKTTVKVRHFFRQPQVEEFDVAVPAKIPERKHRYLTIIGDDDSTTPEENTKQQQSPKQTQSYENSSVELTPEGSDRVTVGRIEKNTYSTPAPGDNTKAASVDTQSSTKYVNQSIQLSQNQGVSFNSNPLHTYTTPKPATPLQSQLSTGVAHHDSEYENSEIHPSSDGGIAVCGEPLHIYHVPNVNAGPIIPPPPPLPPKPSEQVTSRGSNKSPTSASPLVVPPTLPTMVFAKSEPAAIPLPKLPPPQPKTNPQPLTISGEAVAISSLLSAASQSKLSNYPEEEASDGDYDDVETISDRDYDDVEDCCNASAISEVPGYSKLSLFTSGSSQKPPPPPGPPPPLTEATLDAPPKPNHIQPLGTVIQSTQLPSLPIKVAILNSNSIAGTGTLPAPSDQCLSADEIENDYDSITESVSPITASGPRFQFPSVGDEYVDMRSGVRVALEERSDFCQPVANTAGSKGEMQSISAVIQKLAISLGIESEKKSKPLPPPPQVSKTLPHLSSSKEFAPSPSNNDRLARSHTIQNLTQQPAEATEMFNSTLTSRQLPEENRVKGTDLSKPVVSQSSSAAKSASGTVYRFGSWSTPVNNPKEELQKKLKKRADMLQVMGISDNPPVAGESPLPQNPLQMDCNTEKLSPSTENSPSDLPPFNQHEESLTKMSKSPPPSPPQKPVRSNSSTPSPPPPQKSLKPASSSSTTELSTKMPKPLPSPPVKTKAHTVQTPLQKATTSAVPTPPPPPPPPPSPPLKLKPASPKSTTEHHEELSTKTPKPLPSPPAKTKAPTVQTPLKKTTTSAVPTPPPPPPPPPPLKLKPASPKSTTEHHEELSTKTPKPLPSPPTKTKAHTVQIPLKKTTASPPPPPPPLKLKPASPKPTTEHHEELSTKMPKPLPSPPTKTKAHTVQKPLKKTTIQSAVPTSPPPPPPPPPPPASQKKLAAAVLTHKPAPMIPPQSQLKRVQTSSTETGSCASSPSPASQGDLFSKELAEKMKLLSQRSDSD